MLVRPFPRVTQELLASQVAFLNALLRQLVHHLRFRGDRRVVRPRHPTSVLAHHTGPAHQDVLNRIVQHVSHMKHTRHVRRRNDDSVRLTSVGFRTK